MENYGLLEQYDIIAKDWRSGGVSGAVKDVLRADGQYLDFLPDKEIQKGVLFDTKACVTFSALNCLEIIQRTRGVHDNYSDRFIAKLSGTTTSGNYFRTVAETIRTVGLIDEELHPFPNTQKDFDWDDYYSEIPESLLMKGRLWLTLWDIDWEWADMTDLKNALVYGPVQVGVWAWPSVRKDGLYDDGGNKRRNHAVTLVGYKDGEYWTIFDHYAKDIKHLVWDYDFKAGIQYYLNRVTSSDTPMPTITLPNNVLVQDSEGSGAFGMHLNGKIKLGTSGDVLASVVMRSDLDANGNVQIKRVPLGKDDWASFPKTDLKNNPI